MTPRQIGLLAALAAIWGGSYLLIKYALEDFSAPMIVWARCVIAALVLLVALRGAARDPVRRHAAPAGLGAPARDDRDRGAVPADHVR